MIDQITDIVISSAGDYAKYLLVVLGVVIAIGVGMILFNVAWNLVKHGGFDMSGRVMGFYYARTPWRGYNRFRSQKWNEENTL